MRFYTQHHQFYCGIDLHARSMYVCIMNQAGEILVHRNMATTADELVKVIEPYRSDVVLAVECMFTWYWIAELCHQIGVEFVLGHALYRMSDPRRKGEERQDRLPEDSSHASGRDASDGLESIRKACAARGIFCAAGCTWFVREGSSRGISRTPTPSTIFLLSRSA